MARTPLLRAFARLAEEHRTADGSASRRQNCAGSARRLPSTGATSSSAPGSPAAQLRRRPRACACSRTPQRDRTADRDRGRRHRRPERRARARRQERSARRSTRRRPRIGGRMHSDTSGYFSNGQVSEFCGELIDTGHQTIRASRSGSTSPSSTCLRPSRGHRRHVLLLRQRTTRSPRPTRDFQPIATTLDEPDRAAGYPTTYDELDRDGTAARPDVGLRLDRDLRARRPLTPSWAAARRRLQRGVRRRDERSGVAEPALSARASSRAQRFRDLRRLGRALPHRRRQRAAAARRSRYLGRQTIKLGLGDAVDRDERGRHRFDDLLDARGERRPLPPTT